MKFLKKWEAALLLALCFTLCTGLWAGARQRALAAGLIRLHVVADSDAEEEQALKLRVRDRVLELLSPRLEGAETAADARAILESSLEDLEQAARELTGERSVTVTLGEERYPTREYESFSLPAGTYTSLRVIIGSGSGHNWWCVVFPPLCTDPASLTASEVSALSDRDIALITEDGEGYVIKFRILEWWARLLEKLN